MLKKSLIMLKKCTYNSQYIAHYACSSWTDYNINKNQYETWRDLITLSLSVAISVLHMTLIIIVFGFESGHQLIDQPFTSP